MAWRMQPPIIRQGPRQICWACATSSWSRVTRSVPTITVSDLIALMQPISGALNPDQSLTGLGVRYLASHFALQSDPPLSGTAAGTSMLTEVYFASKLSANHVLFFYRTPTPNVNHMILVYGANQSRFYFMDPLPGVYTSREYASFTPPLYLALWRP